MVNACPKRIELKLECKNFKQDKCVILETIFVGWSKKCFILTVCIQDIAGENIYCFIPQSYNFISMVVRLTILVRICGIRVFPDINIRHLP